MRFRVGGTVLDIRPPRLSLKTRQWVLVSGIAFILVLMYVISQPDKDAYLEHDSKRELHESDSASDFKPLPKVDRDYNLLLGRRGVSNDDGSDVRMAMAPAKHLQRKILDLQKKNLREQQRPSDKIYNINVTLSDALSMDREITDTRPSICKSFKYDVASLPKASVIIPFYNEALSMLIRTVHSILNRTPDELLNEIILVDDCSTHEHLKLSFGDYLDLLPKVRIIRNKNREGLIKSRMIGARLSKGPIVIFQDAHTEANVGWLEPLLDELQRHPHSVIQPFVDGIEAMTLEYSSPPSLYKGSFSWDLRYTWLRVPDHEANKAVETGQPFFSPTLVGCAMAVDMRYFKHIGGFDEDLKVWGGENIELGFRVWQCHGRVVTVPCSRVGHVFKNFPYKFDGDRDKIVTKNLMRVAETWMDGYKKFFYAATRVYEFKRVDFTKDELASLELRKQLRQKLKCKNFDWYMHNIIPEVETPPTDAVYYGEIMNLQSRACFETSEDYYVGMTYLCYEHKIIPRNNFRLTAEGLLKYKDKCVTAKAPRPILFLEECPEDTSNLEHFGKFSLLNKGHTWGQIEFKYKNTQGAMTKFCLLQVTNVLDEHNHEQMPQLANCDENNGFSMWAFSYKFDYKA